ncbi:MAG TPA: 30S ribosomal protein S2 [Candidatus Paceibacterota bacterium]
MTEIEKIVGKMGVEGLHFGSQRAMRHPSTVAFVFGTKNEIDIINLEKTHQSLEKAKEFLRALGKEGKKLLLVGNKSEARKVVMEVAISAKLPYVAERWIGGTLTNFDEIRKRVNRLIELTEKGSTALDKYTKRERTKIGHEIKDLERYFRGIEDMSELPAAMLVVDSDKEDIAVTEAGKIGIPVVSVSSTDCDISKIKYPIVANDKSQTSIRYVVGELIKAYKNQ